MVYTLAQYVSHATDDSGRQHRDVTPVMYDVDVVNTPSMYWYTL